jgi:phospholipase C
MTKEKPTNTDDSQSGTSRRAIIKGVAGMAGAAAIGSSFPPSLAAPILNAAAYRGLPPPELSGIDHIVVLMMENRSFDHMLGWVHGANGVQAGRSFVDTSGQSHDSFALTLFQNCASADPDHSFGGGRTQMNGGAMDGFLKTAPVGDQFPIGYYGPDDVPFFASAAKHWTICDNYFCSILGPTWPNRFYMHSGQTDRLTTGGPTPDTNSLLSILPTIWDLAANAGVSARYYFNDSAFTALWGGKYQNISFTFDHFRADAAAGTLPSISYIDPAFVGEGQGTSSDDHPLADIRNGQVFMNTVYQALAASPNWPRTLLIINYDEWGGFADHVAPALAPVSAHEVSVGNVDTAVNPDGTASAFLGLRVPCLLIGPRANRGGVAHEQFDANSILNFITWRFGLPGIGIRAATSGNIASALDFSGPPKVKLPPPVPLVSQVYGSSCANNPMADLGHINNTFAEHYADLDKVKALMIEHNFKLA